MYIEGRKSKPYSESLFNQLYLLAMLIQSESNLPDYIIDSRLKKSERTYRRYFHDLHQCGLMPKVIRSAAPSSEDELSGESAKSFSYSIPYETDDIDQYYDKRTKHYYYDDVEVMLKYLDSYSMNHFNPQDRLYRLGRVLICSYYDCYLVDPDDIEDEPGTHEPKDLVRISFKGYEDLYEGMSLRSRQRDFKLLRDVITTVLLDHDALG